MKDSSSIIVNVSRVWFHNPVWIVNPIFAFLGYLKKKYFYPVPTLCNSVCIYNQYKILLHIFLARYCQDLWIIAPYIQLSPTFHLLFISWAVNLHCVKKVFVLCGVSSEIIHNAACFTCQSFWRYRPNELCSLIFTCLLQLCFHKPTL